MAKKLYTRDLTGRLIRFLIQKAIEQGGKMAQGFLVVCNPTKLIKDHFPEVPHGGQRVQELRRKGILIPLHAPKRGSRHNEYMIISKVNKKTNESLQNISDLDLGKGLLNILASKKFKNGGKVVISFEFNLNELLDSLLFRAE